MVQGLKWWLNLACKVLNLEEYLLPNHAPGHAEADGPPPQVIPVGMPGEDEASLSLYSNVPNGDYAVEASIFTLYWVFPQSPVVLQNSHIQKTCVSHAGDRDDARQESWRREMDGARSCSGRLFALSGLLLGTLLCLNTALVILPITIGDSILLSAAPLMHLMTYLFSVASKSASSRQFLLLLATYREKGRDASALSLSQAGSSCSICCRHFFISAMLKSNLSDCCMGRKFLAVACEWPASL